MENFQDIKGLVFNCVKISVEIQDIENFQAMEVFQNLEASIKHSIRKTIGV